MAVAPISRLVSLVLTGASAAAATEYAALAGYTPTSNVTAAANFDLKLANLSSAMGAADYGWALEAYTSTADASVPSLAQMSLQARELMENEEAFTVFAAYYNDFCFADNFTRDAILGRDAFSTWSNDSRAELATKGAAYQNTFHWVQHLLTTGVTQCIAGQVNDNTGGPRSWDLAWAFFAGSLEGTDGQGSGKSVYALGDKRCPQFGTCEDTDEALATSNEKARAYWQSGRSAIRRGDCFTARTAQDGILAQMAVPLIQGTLREAFEIDPDGGASGADGSVEIAEGWAFAAAVLPLVARCDSDAGEVVYNNTWINMDPVSPDGFAAVKDALESTYDCLGITCGDVGGMMTCSDDDSLDADGDG